MAVHGLTLWAEENCVSKENDTKPYTKMFKCTTIFTLFVVWQKLKNQLILLFNLFLLLFMRLTALFDTIYGSHYTISISFYIYL